MRACFSCSIKIASNQELGHMASLAGKLGLFDASAYDVQYEKRT